MIKAVIFDLDGTLYDYEECNRRAERVLLEQVGILGGVTVDVAKRLFVKAKESVKNQLGTVGASHNRLLYMQKVCEKLKVNPLLYAMELYDRYWDTMLNYIELYEYVIPLFESLRNTGIKIGILTDLTAHIQYRKIRRLGIALYIDYITTSEEAGEEKPSRKIFETMLRKMEFNAGEILMVGDNMERDIEGALSVGMQAICFTPDMDIKKEVMEMCI